MSNKAKTSKNNPNARKGGNQILFKGKVIKPCKLNDGQREYMAAEYADNSIVKLNNEILTWKMLSDLHTSNKK